MMHDNKKDLGSIFAEAGSLFESLLYTVARLRDPVEGCAWDLRQTHESLIRYLKEEAEEVVAAIKSGCERQLTDELGDVLLQVVLHAQILLDNRRGDVRHVIGAIDAKLRRRHPHVFSDGSSQGDEVDHQRQWQTIKQKEQAQKGRAFGDCDGQHTSATFLAEKIGQIASTIGFDWDEPSEVLAVLRSEVTELAEAQDGKNFSSAEVLDELGDVFFTWAQCVRHFGFTPESAARHGNNKFLRRFSRVEDLTVQSGRSLSDISRAEMERYWVQAKESRAEGSLHE